MLVSRGRNGFTLMELILVIAVLGVLAGIVLPRLSNVMPAARDQDAIARALTLNQATFTYSKRVGNAANNWAAATTDNARFSLIYNAGYLPGAPDTLAAYQPSGYSFTFNSNLANPRVAIVGPNGTLSYN